MPFNVLLLPLLGGYLFLTRWNRTRFSTKRYSGERLIFHSAVAGVALLCISFILVQTLIGLVPRAYAGWSEIVPFNYTGTSFGAFLLGCVAWWPLNKWWYPEEEERRRVIREWGNHLEELFEEAIQGTRQVALSMKSGKVYVGFPTDNIDPAYDRKYVYLLPVSSGYRDPETQTMVLTTGYEEVYLQLADGDIDFDPESFKIVLPVSEINSANWFDPRAYRLFNPPEEDQPAEDDPT